MKPAQENRAAESRGLVLSSDRVRLLLAGATQLRIPLTREAPATVRCAGVFIGGPENANWMLVDGDPHDIDTWDITGDAFRCPHGQPGDRLWIREQFQYPADLLTGPYTPGKVPIRFVADGAVLPGEPPKEWGPTHRAQFLHPDRARLIYRIEDIQVERLQEMSIEDINAQALQHYDAVQPWPDNWYADPYQPAAHLWNRTYGDGAWEKNPLVWIFQLARIPK